MFPSNLYAEILRPNVIITGENKKLNEERGMGHTELSLSRGDS